MPLTDEQETKFREYVFQLEASRKKLSDWERAFFDDQMKRYTEWGARMNLSGKQWAVLDRMYEKVTEL